MKKRGKVECEHGMQLAIVLLVIGFWFLLVDLGHLPDWGINWWTVAFLLMGAKHMHHYLG